MGKLDGKVAFISGAARGQGRSHAVRLAQEGADIIAIDICERLATVSYPSATREQLRRTARAVEAVGRRIVLGEVDVRDLAALQEIADKGISALGHIDIVIANAGIGTYAPALEMREDMWQMMIDVNLTGVWKTIRAAVPHVVAGGQGGSVVLTSSLAALRGANNTAHYSAAKTGLIGMMRVLAKELAPQDIRVNTVHPTAVATEMILNEAMYRLFRPELPNPTRADFEESARWMHRLPLAMIDPVDVSNAVVYLVSDDGRYVTGTTHFVDAGGRL